MPTDDLESRAQAFAEKYGPSLEMAPEGGLVIFARAEVRRALEAACRAAEGAALPRGYRWGDDALEAFTFGKERAAGAIRALMASEEG